MGHCALGGDWREPCLAWGPCPRGRGHERGWSEHGGTFDPLAEGFRTPPDSAKPWCYWWWLDSNAAKEGITADLEEMKRQGIAGALIFDAGKGTNPPHDDFKPRIRGGNDFDPAQGTRFTDWPFVYGSGVAGIIQVCRSGS